MKYINRLYNCRNPYQGDYKRVLCVCSAGLLRSPTAALVLANEPFNFNTRAAGIDAGHALIVVDEVLLEWADEIVCMDSQQQTVLADQTSKPVINLDIPDNFAYRSSHLVEMIKTHYSAVIKGRYDEKTTIEKTSSSSSAQDVHSSQPKNGAAD